MCTGCCDCCCFSLGGGDRKVSPNVVNNNNNNNNNNNGINTNTNGAVATIESVPGSPARISKETTNGIEKNRSCTNSICILVLSFYLITLLILTIYCMKFADLKRITHGYDDCANLCGINNEQDPEHACKGSNFANRKYLLVEISGDYENGNHGVHRSCVSACEEPYTALLNRCIDKKSQQYAKSFFSRTGFVNTFQEFAEDLELAWREILLLLLLPFVLSLVMIFLLRFLAGIIIWIILIGIVVTCIVGTVYLWIRYNNDRRTEFLIYAIIMTVFTVVICLIILVLRKRIKLVGQLFAEAGKAIAAMPLLLCQPFITFFSIVGIFCAWLYVVVMIESAGIMTIEENKSAKYVKTTEMKFTRFYNFFFIIWMSLMFLDCQDMIIAGAVCQWFFTRNKSRLKSPIWTSYSNLVRYHVGTVIFGSLIIAIIKFIRMLLNMMQKMTDQMSPGNQMLQCCYGCVNCCLGVIGRIVQTITRNAYIITALYGYSFCKAGKRAYSILTNNALRVIAINSVGDFVLVFAKILIVIITLLISNEVLEQKEGLSHPYIPLILIAIVSYLIANCFMCVYEMVIDSIFICFCEDCEMNDGISKPYYMSRGLMEYVQNSKKVLQVHDSRTAKAWSGQ